MPIGKNRHAISTLAQKLIDIPIYRHRRSFSVIFDILFSRILQVPVLIDKRSSVRQHFVVRFGDAHINTPVSGLCRNVPRNDKADDKLLHILDFTGLLPTLVLEQEDVRNAFLRHSTSKIRKVDDLAHISSLGFRGEALSSIAAVSQVEMITKTEESVCGTAYQISGGKEVSLEETGARDGTTFLVRQLFYNVPARRKFLKTPMTEASHVSDLMTRLALSRPDISFQFINNGQERMHTSGNGKLKDVIYHVMGGDHAI